MAEYYSRHFPIICFFGFISPASLGEVKRGPRVPGGGGGRSTSPSFPKLLGIPSMQQSIYRVPTGCQALFRLLGTPSEEEWRLCSEPGCPGCFCYLRYPAPCCSLGFQLISPEVSAGHEDLAEPVFSEAMPAPPLPRERPLLGSGKVPLLSLRFLPAEDVCGSDGGGGAWGTIPAVPHLGCMLAGRRLPGTYVSLGPWEHFVGSGSWVFPFRLALWSKIIRFSESLTQASTCWRSLR